MRQPAAGLTIGFGVRERSLDRLVLLLETVTSLRTDERMPPAPSWIVLTALRLVGPECRPGTQRTYGHGGSELSPTSRWTISDATAMA